MMPILFQEDWNKHPNAIADWSTKNRSFVEFSQKLKLMGVQNNCFMLALLNPLLKGIDPHNPNLSEDIKTMIGEECTNNWWYYIREVARAPAKSGTQVNYVAANRANISLWWSFFNYINYILIQPRQTGKSFSTDQLIKWLVNIRCRNTLVNLLTLSEKLRRETVGRIKEIFDTLPSFLNFRTKYDANNNEFIDIKKHNNRYMTNIAQASEAAAEASGRGMSTAILHIDEAPFQANISTSYAAAYGSMSAAVDAAVSQGNPAGIIMTTTAGKIDDPNGEFVFNMIKESFNWDEKLYDLKDKDALNKFFIDNNNGVFRIHGCFNHRQVGKTDEWLINKIKNAGSDEDKINRDWLNVWTSGTAKSPLSIEQNKKLVKSIKDPSYIEKDLSTNFSINWYIDKNLIFNVMNSNKTILGIDTSEAINKDNIAMVIMNIHDGRVIATSSINKTNTMVYAKWLADLIIKYPQMTVIMERRSSGGPILDLIYRILILNKINPFRRLYNKVVQDPVKYETFFDRLVKTSIIKDPNEADEARAEFGFPTSASGEYSRNSLYSELLLHSVDNFGDYVYDETLVRQLTGLIYDPDKKRMDHSRGGHDDSVVAYLLCNWFLNNAKNIIYYGIDPNSVMSSRAIPVITNKIEYLEALKQQEYRNRVTEIFNELKKTQDQFIKFRLVNELRILESKIVLNANEHFSVDAILEEIKRSNKSKCR